MVLTNAAVCQVISVTEKEAVTVSFKSTSVLNVTHYVSILRDWGNQKRIDAFSSSAYFMPFLILLLFRNY